MSEKKPFNNPFGALSGLKESLPTGPAKEERAREKSKPPARCVIRLERAGRKGKEVTVLDHLELPVDQREVWLGEMKAALGCGGVVEGVTLVLQGDQRERAEAWLKKKGVRQVVVGN